jgi:putative peptidoglycan lipid II flippase
VLRYPLVRLLFEHGAFKAQDTQITVETMPYFFGALFFGGMVMILVNIYFATKKMGVAVGTGVISLGVNIALSLWLIHPLEQKGLALANSISAFVNLVLLTLGLFIILRLHEKAQLPWREGLNFLWRIVLSVAGMAGAVWGIREFAGASVKMGSPLPTLGAVGVGFLVYLGMLGALRVKEVRDGVKLVIRRVVR